MFKGKRRNGPLIILAFIMLINAMSSGILIPLLYPYSSKFGINPFGLSMLFASFAFFQFLSTPIIGRLADRYGRKPLLLISIFGSFLSLALFASAKTIFVLFLARILDGITGGNVSVAQAMIADTSTGKDRAKGFGVLGAMWGLGFLIGPAIGGLLSVISLTAPFWFASFLALLATILGAIILKETLVEKVVLKQKSEPLFNFKAIGTALLSPTIGSALLITFISYFAHHALIIAFQTYTVDQLKLDSQTIGIIFAVVGLLLVLSRSVVLRFVLNQFSSNRKIIAVSLLLSSISLFLIPFFPGLTAFLIFTFFYILVYSLAHPVLTSIISKRVNLEDQGVAMGINQSYASLGQVLGPISAGLISQIGINLIFFWSSLFLFLGFLLTYSLKIKSKKANL